MLLRRAVDSDALDVPMWRNDPQATAMSGTPAAVNPDEHCRWFEKSLNSPDRPMFIGVVGTEKIGVVRRASVTIDQKLRQQLRPVVLHLPTALLTGLLTNVKISVRAGTKSRVVRSGRAGNMVVINKEEGWIGHRLNILGIRVWADKCQLVAQTGGDWTTLGPARPLPLHVPTNAEELARATRDSLLITAYQYAAAHPDSDLPELLAQRKDFAAALNAP